MLFNDAAVRLTREAEARCGRCPSLMPSLTRARQHREPEVEMLYRSKGPMVRLTAAALTLPPHSLPQQAPPSAT
jgi:hypothetical protein